MTIIGASTYYSATSRHSISDTLKSTSSETSPEFDGCDVENNAKAQVSSDIESTSTAHESLNERLKGLTLNKGSDLPALKPAWERLSDEEYAAYQAMERDFIDMDARALQSEYRKFYDDPNDPRIERYADIVVGGKIVASVDNQGLITASSDTIGKRLAVLSLEDTGLQGPEQAKYTSEKLIKLLGGSISLADTAITQSTFNRIVQLAQAQIDFEGMKADPKYDEINRRYEELAQSDIARSQR
ncbi:hypothetical protein GAO09_10300 [Rhizobiales bacterium RZME27]|jgi:hypothetical protein|uniref:Uncharacterized protein n=1 Tax=Endobacterium cereale TaxID=2663029 RepID=A0A6A8A5A5_9HYPH|nr:hypothetical protein [Endobacterium cereale]MEB2846640.1 hypothetical protein [Endobacterium cereale]MQY46435.1 hypothetical protein [Endobacterium cereale]